MAHGTQIPWDTLSLERERETETLHHAQTTDGFSPCISSQPYHQRDTGWHVPSSSHLPVTKVSPPRA